MIDIVKDFLISTFFEGALAISWVGILVVAWLDPVRFLDAPLKTIGAAIKPLWEKCCRPSIAVIIIISLYLVGTVMQRVSEDFVETTSSWLPKAIKKETNEPTDRSGKQHTEEQNENNDEKRVSVLCKQPKEKEGTEGKPATVQDSKNSKATLPNNRDGHDFILCLPENSMLIFTPVGTDRYVKNLIMNRYRHLLTGDDSLARSNLNLDSNELDKTLRDTRIRRAFADEKSGPYMQRLLELVRISQATLMHSFMASFVLASLFAFGVMTQALYVKERGLARIVKMTLGIVAGVFVIAVWSWAFYYAPQFQRAGEYNVPVMFMFVATFIPLVAIGLRLLRHASRDKHESLTGKNMSRPSLHLVSSAAMAFIFCYWSTFSWAEHRENYLESGLILGQSSAVSAQDTLPENGKALSLAPRIKELSGSTVLRNELFIADDELVGTLIRITRPAGKQTEAKLVKLERKRKDSQPFNNKPRLAAIQDIEGLASDGKSNMYLIGSHNPKYGDRRTDREFLLHVSYDDNELTWQGEYRSLLEDIREPLKTAGVALDVTKTTLSTIFNVEGLAYHDNKLYIGLRAPLTHNRQAILAITDANTIFQEHSKAVFEIHLLPLEGAGIRSLDWDQDTKKLLILSGPSGEEAEQSPALWSYDPKARKLEVMHAFSNKELERGDKSGGRYPEGVSRWNGRLVVVFDYEKKDKDKTREIMFLNSP